MEITVFFYGIMADITGSHSRHYRNVTSPGDLRHRLEDDFPGMAHMSYRLTSGRESGKRIKVLSDGGEVACMTDCPHGED